LIPELYKLVFHLEKSYKKDFNDKQAEIARLGNFELKSSAFSKTENITNRVSSKVVFLIKI